MIWHLIATLFAGLGAAGIGLLMRSLSGKRLPRWITPVMAGLGMLGYQIQHEYGWYMHTQAQLPDSARIIASSQEATLWRPWTYLLSMTTAFTVVDRESLSVTQANDQTLARFILYRFTSGIGQTVRHQPYLLNCESRELVPLDKKNQQLKTDQMRRLGHADNLYKEICHSDPVSS